MLSSAHQVGGQLRIQDAHEAAEPQQLGLHAPAVRVEVRLHHSTVAEHLLRNSLLHCFPRMSLQPLQELAHSTPAHA